MTRAHAVPAILSALTLAAAASSGLLASPAPSRGSIEILVDGRSAPEYRAGGVRYVEALRGKTYAIRLHNPFDVRVAVALSVDGLNTIDARHTTAAAARKWVLDPHETVTISGWQTSMAEARRFFFTTEDRSYAGRLGQPENMGTISAAFFRERTPERVMAFAQGQTPAEAPAPASAAERAAVGASSKREQAAAADEYAATGMGGRTSHQVTAVHIDLEDAPASTTDIRYEYRAALVRLGVLPDVATPDPLSRRQNAHGFDKGFCPDIRER